MGKFLNQIRKKLGLEPQRDMTLTGKIPNEVVISRATQNESAEPEVHHHVTQGRFNPLTTGHESVVNAVKKAAKKDNAGHTIILTGSHDAKKNPLSPEQKLKHAKRAFPDTNIKVSDKEHPTILHHLSNLHDQGVTHLHLHVGSDRADAFHDLIHKYNGQQSKHGHYNFKSITIHKVGKERSDEADDVSGASGTKMRQHAASGNKEEFKKMAPSKMSDAHKEDMYNDVRSGMSIKESSEGFPVPAIPTRDVRDDNGKPSSLNKLPAPGPKGDIGKDTNLKADDKKSTFELMRRRAYKRASFMEGFDGIDSALETPKAPASSVTVNSVPSIRPKVAKKINSEGTLTDVSGEQGSPTLSSDGIGVSSDSTTIRTSKAPKKFGTFREETIEEKRGLWDNIHAKRERIKRGSGERMRKPGSEGAPTAAALKASQTEEVLHERGEDKKGYFRSTESGAGITRKGAKAMGIKTAVTTPPSKLDPKGEAAGRRRSFCARMGGMKGPMKDEKGRPTRKAMSLRRWNCEEVEQIDELKASTLRSYLIKNKDKRENSPGKDYSNPVSFRKAMLAPGIAHAKLGKTFKRQSLPDVKIRATKEEVELSEGTKVAKPRKDRYGNDLNIGDHVTVAGTTGLAHSVINKGFFKVREHRGRSAVLEPAGSNSKRTRTNHVISHDRLTKLDIHAVPKFRYKKKYGQHLVTKDGVSHHSYETEHEAKEYITKNQGKTHAELDHSGHDKIDEGVELDEAHKIGTKVTIHKGEGAGITGHIGEIRRKFKGDANPSYTIFHGENDAIRVNKSQIKAVNEKIEYDDDDEGYTQKAGQFYRGDRVKIKKDGYSGKGNIDMYDPASGTYVVSVDKHGSNLHLKSHEIEPIKESLTDRVKAIMEGKK